MQLEGQLLSGLQQAVLQPGAINYVLDEFRSLLQSAQLDRPQEKQRAQERIKELKEQLRRLTVAVAEGGHSAFLLDAISERERELGELDSSLATTCSGLGNSSEEVRQFALRRLSALPDLFSCDIPRARAELAKHVTQITLTPAETNENRHYSCTGEWNLLGTLSGGDVRMVAGGGFEPPTFGL